MTALSAPAGQALCVRAGPEYSGPSFKEGRPDLSGQGGSGNRTLVATRIQLKHNLPQPLHNLQHRRANQRIPVGQIQDLNHLPPIGMRVLSACLWPVFINTAIIIAIQKRAGRRLQYIILILVDTQILFYKVTRPHTQAFGNAFYICLVKNRAGCLATVGTLQAIRFCKHLVVQAVKRIVEPPRVLPFQTGQELLILRGTLFRPFAELL